MQNRLIGRIHLLHRWGRGHSRGQLSCRRGDGRLYILSRGIDGTIERELNLAPVRAELERAKADGIKAIAILFMHAYRYPEHEQRVAKLARDMGFPQVSVSHEVSPLIKLVGRGDTTVVDAYLSPILRRYVATVDSELDAKKSGARLMFMMSSGGLTAAELFRGKDAILSGPAGGVVGMAETGREAGFKNLIGFDMGGTSTDVSHYDGEYERAFETEVAGVRMRAPMMLIHTVAAGGGSILHFDGARFRVGPDSAGANPGPKCYRRGGPLAVTDANVMAGKLIADFFPKIFGPGQDLALDADAVRAAFDALAKEIGKLVSAWSWSSLPPSFFWPQSGSPPRSSITKANFTRVCFSSAAFLANLLRLLANSCVCASNATRFARNEIVRAITAAPSRSMITSELIVTPCLCR